jgi:hypothetical protein
MTAFGLALALGPVDDWTRIRFGYELAPSLATDLRAGLIAAASIGLVLCGGLAIRAWRRAGDYVSAAEQMDAIVNARQQVLTFATLTDPSRPRSPGEPSVLFPILRRTVADYLARFDSRIAFPIRPARPLRRGSAVAFAVALLFGIAMMALVRPPSPEAV